MPRSGEGARRRLQAAALQLWGEQGYDCTTAAEIAARAGVTERTFFRHFPDKREVLFDEAPVLQAALVSALAAIPAGVRPVDALLRAFGAAEPMFREHGPLVGVRQRVIAETPALQERELAKAAGLAAALAEVLRRRGVEAGEAAMAAQVGMAVFNQATSSWIEDPARGLKLHLQRAWARLRALSSAPDI